MTPPPTPRRPLERVALTLLAQRPDTTAAVVVGVASVVDNDDVSGRAVELTRSLALHNGAPALLLEANIRRQSRLAPAMEIDAGPGLLDVLRDPERATDAVRPTPDPRLWVMTAGAGAPSPDPIALADFSDTVETLRRGSWAVGRRVLDIRDGEDRGSMAERRRALVTVGSDVSGEEAEQAPRRREGAELRPFNEGPPADAAALASAVGLPPLPPLASGPRSSSRSPEPSSRARNGRRSRVPSVVVIAPPFDDGSDADVVAAPCDQMILLVHLGEATRQQVADAVGRIGSRRLLGTIVVTPRSRRTR